MEFALGLNLGGWVHSGSLWVSSRVVEFTCVLTGSHPGTLGTLGFALGVVGFILSGWVPSSRVVALGSLGSSWDVAFSLGNGGFILGRWIHLGASLSSSGVVVFTRVRPGSLGASAGCTQRVVLSL